MTISEIYQLAITMGMAADFVEIMANENGVFDEAEILETGAAIVMAPSSTPRIPRKRQESPGWKPQKTATMKTDPAVSNP